MDPRGAVTGAGLSPRSILTVCWKKHNAGLKGKAPEKVELNQIWLDWLPGCDLDTSSGWFWRWMESHVLVLSSGIAAWAGRSECVRTSVCWGEQTHLCALPHGYKIKPTERKGQRASGTEVGWCCGPVQTCSGRSDPEQGTVLLLLRHCPWCAVGRSRRQKVV